MFGIFCYVWCIVVLLDWIDVIDVGKLLVV